MITQEGIDRVFGWIGEWRLPIGLLVFVIVGGVLLGLGLSEFAERRHRDQICLEYGIIVVPTGKTVIPVRRCKEWGTIVSETVTNAD